MLLPKGFEVEMYTGTPDGHAVGLSDRIVAQFAGFAREPDLRNVEYITEPILRYDQLPCALLRPRVQVRDFIGSLGDYTLLPGSTIAMEGGDRFQRSDPSNSYHDYIEQTYGTSVVTASVHINVGIDDSEAIIRACRLLRAEAALYLALSASSPFANGLVTGAHSTRWQVFPKTPAHVPIFTSHADYIHWVEAQLAAGSMTNVRHLWSSVRPNGPERPYQINRIELRICEMVGDPIALIAIAALMEARIHQMLLHPDQFDPLNGAFTPDELASICDRNEAAAAQSSLDAMLIHWQTGETIQAAEWLDRQYAEAWMFSHRHGFSCFLSPIQTILNHGNEAQRWLRKISSGLTVADVYSQAIAELHQRELDLIEALCPPANVA